jgi:alpha-L-rhamnosidase
VDFGVTMSGYMEITLTAPRGDEIVFRYAEEIDDQQHLKHNRMDRPHFYRDTPFQVDKLIASGGRDTFKPMFTYHGFRYVLIEGLRSAPSASDMRAYFTHQDIGRTSGFDSGSDVLNYIYRAGIRSTYSNLFWSLTDCPTREKLGWANDAQASVEQTLINFDILPLYKKWFEDVKAAMRDDGALPGIIPSSGWGFDAGPICDGLLYELPYRIYLYTGDAQMLTGAIPYFERYIQYLGGKIAEGHTFTYGDWMGYTCSKVVPKNFVRDFYFMKALFVTKEAHALAKPAMTGGRYGTRRKKRLFWTGIWTNTTGASSTSRAHWRCSNRPGCTVTGRSSSVS